MTIDYILYQDQVDGLKKAIGECREAFRKYRVAQAKAEWVIDKILTRRINDYNREKSNAGIRMVTIMGMADKNNPEREQLKLAHRAYLDNSAEAEVARVEIEAYRADLIANQSLVKFQQDGERYLMI